MDCGSFHGQDLAGSIDRLKVERCGLSFQSEKHVARPACTREQQQRTASQSNRTEQRTSAPHTCKYTQGFTFVHRRQAAGVHLQCHITDAEGQPHNAHVQLTRSCCFIHVQHFYKHTLPFFGQSPS